MYTRVRRPQNAGAGPRIQHSVIDVPILVDFLCSNLTHMARDARPYPFSRAQVRARWDKILEALGLPLGCLTPRSLRGGGTVWLFERTHNLGYVLWRGRWMKEETLHFYLQEALVARLMSEIPRDARDRVCSLCTIFDHIL